MLQDPDDAVGPFHFHLVDALQDRIHVRGAARFETFAQHRVVDGDGRIQVINAVEAAGGETFLRERPLPGTEYLFRVVLPRRIVDLVEDVQELVGVGAAHGVRHQMLQSVLHGAGLGVSGIEEHQHQVRQVDDVIGDLQGCRALLVGVEAR